MRTPLYPGKRGPERWLRSRIAGALLGLGLLTQPALADPWNVAAHLPDTTEVYVHARLLPQGAAGRSLARRLDRHPLLKLATELLSKGGGPALDMRLWDWLDGEVFLAWERRGERSALDDWLRYDTAYSTAAGAQLELESVAGAIRSYHTERKKYPPDLKTLMGANLLEALPTSEDWDMTYELRDGQPQLLLHWKNESVGQFFEDMQYSLGDSSSQLKYRNLPLNLVVGLRCSQEAGARKFLGSLKEAGLLDQEGTVSERGLQVRFTLQGGWLLLSDKAELAQGLVNGPAAGHTLLDNPRFAYQSKRLWPQEGLPENLFFCDVADILQHTPQLPPPARQATLSSLQSVCASLATLNGAEPEIRAEAFIHLTPPSGHPLHALLGGTGGLPLTVMDDIPWLSSSATVFSLPEMLSLHDLVSELHPQAGVKSAQAWAHLEERLGFPFPKETLRQPGASVTVFTERIDTFTGVLRGTLLYVVGKGAGEATEELPRPWEMMPATFVVKGLEGATQDRLKPRLETALGRGARPGSSESLENSYKVSSNGRLALATVGPRLLFATGGTPRLLERVLVCLEGGEAPVSRLASWQSFQQRLVGQVVVLGAAKVDVVYSALKTFLLFNGADFRREAYALGRYRDAYAAVSTEADGIRVFSGIYATEQEVGQP